MSTLKQWARNQKFKPSASTMNKNWIHTPDALAQGHIVYLVKFLGYTDVDQPKGTEIVKEGIRKIKFNNQLRKADGLSNGKLPKIEFTVSVDGVTIQDPKSKVISHQYPLHRISYCADDKSDKKIFSFIAKEASSDQHTFFVLVSDKCAEEITLTVGQAFDLAYRRFLDSSGKDMEMKKSYMLLQKKTQQLESENKQLKQRIAQLEGRGGAASPGSPALTLKEKAQEVVSDRLARCCRGRRLLPRMQQKDPGIIQHPALHAPSSMMLSWAPPSSQNATKRSRHRPAPCVARP